jgi:hypothetical protein
MNMYVRANDDSICTGMQMQRVCANDDSICTGMQMQRVCRWYVCL